MKKPIVSILLACYKSEQLLEKVFLPSLRHVTIPIEIIFYDNTGNGSKDGLSVLEHSSGSLNPVLRKHKNENDNLTFLILGKSPMVKEQNIGLNAALNECARAATGDFFFLPHTDMYLLPNCLENLVAATKNQAPLSYLLCSRSIEPSQGHTPHHHIRNYGQEPEEFQEQRMLSECGQFINDIGVQVGARMPFFMHRKLWEKMNGVDAHYFSYCTDDDLIQTAYDVGVRKFWMTDNSLVYHLQGKSNNQQKVDKDSNEPYEYFVNKWKQKYPDVSHPGQYHHKIIPLYSRVK